MPDLTVSVPAREDAFCGIFADGPFSRKVFSREENATRITFPQGSAVILYLTFPARREAHILRVTDGDPGAVSLPGCSRKVSLLCSVSASRTDRLRRAAAFLEKHAKDSGGFFGRNDGFYVRLFFIITARGKLSFRAVSKLADCSAQKSQEEYP